MTVRKFSAVVRRGRTLETLEAMRNQIGVDLEACDSVRDKAPLYLRLADVLERIDRIRPAERKGDAVDEITARRTARGAGQPPAEDSVRPAGAGELLG